MFSQSKALVQHCRDLEHGQHSLDKLSGRNLAVVLSTHLNTSSGPTPGSEARMTFSRLRARM